MKRIISIAVCVAMTIGAFQLSAQNHRRQSQPRHNHSTAVATATAKCGCGNCNCTGECEFGTCKCGSCVAQRLNHGVEWNGKKVVVDELQAERRARYLQRHLRLTNNQYDNVFNAEKFQIQRAKERGFGVNREIQNVSRRENATLNREFRNIHREYDSRLKGILDKDQWNLYEKMNSIRRRSR